MGRLIISEQDGLYVWLSLPLGCQHPEWSGVKHAFEPGYIRDRPVSPPGLVDGRRRVHIF